MAVATAAETLASWKAAMANPQTQQAYIAGINKVTESPMEKAAAAVDSYQAGVMAAVASGKYVNNLRSVTLQTYKQNATQVGAQRLGTGAAKASPKYERFVQKYQPVWQQMQDAAASVTGPKSLARAQARAAAALQIIMAAAGKA